MINAGPGSGNDPSHSFPSTCATPRCSTTMDLPMAPSPENRVTLRNGMRSSTHHSRSGTGWSCHSRTLINGNGSEDDVTSLETEGAWGAAAAVTGALFSLAG